MPRSSPLGPCERAALALALLLVPLVACPAWSQTRVVRDGTLGPGAGVQPGFVDTPTGIEVQVDESLGLRSGESLFHSFQAFDVGAGDGVHFSADPGRETSRVISRVTGGDPSNIFGQLRSSVPGADLYLLNPSGVVFGAGASLDVDGSFYAASADRLDLGDEGFFSARPDTPSVLRAAPPSAFGFFEGNAGRVSADGASLVVPEGEALWLAGSEAAAGGSGLATSLSAPGGGVVLVGAGPEGSRVVFDPDAPASTPGVEADLAGGAVLVAAAARVSAGGDTPGAVHVLAGDALLRGSLDADGTGAGGGGTVRARVTGTLAVSGRLTADALGAGDAGRVVVRGRPTVLLEPGALLAARSAPAAGAGAGGDAGEVHLSVRELDALPGARIDVSSTPDSSGDAGLVRIESRDRVRFTGSGVGGLDLQAPDGVAAGSGILATSLGGGRAGRIEVAGRGGESGVRPALVLRDGAVLAVSGARGQGEGRVEVQARRVALRSGALIDGSTLEGERGGDLSVRATSKISVGGVGSDGTPSQIRSVTAGPGDAGSIELAAPRIELAEGARVSTMAIPAAGDGDAGGIELRANKLRVESGAIVDSSTLGAGRAGRVQLIGFEDDTARQVVVGGAGTLVTGSTAGAGDGSEVLVEAERIAVRDGAVLATRSAPDPGVAAAALSDLAAADVGGGPLADTLARLDDPDRTVEGDGGLLRLRAGRKVVLRGGRIESVARSEGDAGSIAIEAPAVRLDGGVMSASTSGPGMGGRVSVEGVRRLRLSDGSVVEAVSRGAPGETAPGDAGAIRIDGAPGASVEITDSRIETSSVGSGGGSIAIGSDGAAIALVDSTVRTDVLAGDRQAGNIVFRGQSLTASGSEIVARAAQGQGGSIDFLVSDFQPSADTVIASTSSAGFDGRVRVRSPETLTANDNVTPLEAEFLDPRAFLRRDCAARAAESPGGSFTVTPVREPGAGDDWSAAWAPVIPASSAAATPSGGAAGTGSAAFAALRRSANEARESARAGARERAVSQLASLDAALAAFLGAGTDESASVDLRIHEAGTWAALAERAGDDRETASADLLRAYEVLRDAARRAARAGDERGRAQALGHMAELYRREARLDEALFLVRRAVAASERAGDAASLSRWSWQEGRIQWERGESSEAIEAFARAAAVEERRSPPGAGLRRDVTPLYHDWAGALLDTAGRMEDPDARAALLLRARDVMERLKVAELRDYFRDECIADLEARRTPLDAISASAAIVYPIPLPDRLELLVSVGGVLERHRVEVGSERVVRTARRFRESVENRLSYDFLESGAALYDWLVRPYAAALHRRGVDTLVFVPDRSLVGIPLAALRGDGAYLGERFALAVTPGLALVDPRPLSHGPLQPLLAGLSEPVDGFPPLEAVPEELAAIRALQGGEVLLDGQFEKTRLAREVAARRPAVVHIASHAVFTGDPETSFLLAHDGPIRMDALAAIVGQNRFAEQPVELLMLSACETAAGDERAALGLAGMAVRAGARSAVGSLWTVDDAAARRFVVEFYRGLREPGVGRAEALRRAQGLLREDGRYAHPYYWSGFLMISDWQ